MGDLEHIQIIVEGSSLSDLDPLPLTCDVGLVYVARIRYCLESALISQQAVIDALLYTPPPCLGGTFTSRHEIEALRFCTHITSSLVLLGVTESIDPTVFWDIEQIDGLI